MWAVSIYFTIPFRHTIPVKELILYYITPVLLILKYFYSAAFNCIAFRIAKVITALHYLYASHAWMKSVLFWWCLSVSSVCACMCVCPCIDWKTTNQKWCNLVGICVTVSPCSGQMLVFYWGLTSTAISVFLDKKVAYNLKTTGQLLMQFYMIMYHT